MKPDPSGDSGQASVTHKLPEEAHFITRTETIVDATFEEAPRQRSKVFEDDCGFFRGTARQLVFPAYVLAHGSRGVGLTLALPSRGICLCAIHDCILERFYAEDKSA